jgi:hypothetical protein
MTHDTHKRDFSSNARLPGISALAAGIGALSTLAAFVLLGLIHLFTNLFFFGAFSFADRSPAHNTLGAWYSGSDRSHPVRQEPHVAQSRDPQTAVVRRCDWQRRTVRR